MKNENDWRMYDKNKPGSGSSPNTDPDSSPVTITTLDVAAGSSTARTESTVELNPSTVNRKQPVRETEVEKMLTGSANTMAGF